MNITGYKQNELNKMANRIKQGTQKELKCIKCSNPYYDNDPFTMNINTVCMDCIKQEEAKE